jgi:hypothetical protein
VAFVAKRLQRLATVIVSAVHVVNIGSHDNKATGSAVTAKRFVLQHRRPELLPLSPIELERALRVSVTA